MEKYLADDKVPDKLVTLGKEEVNLLEKAKGAVEYLKGLTVEFTSSTQGYKSITQMIKLIEQSQELDVSREADKKTDEQELDIF